MSESIQMTIVAIGAMLAGYAGFMKYQTVNQNTDATYNPTTSTIMLVAGIAIVIIFTSFKF